MTNQTSKIRQLNDFCRTTFFNVRVILTPGVQALPEAGRDAVISQVRSFTDFSPDNDPHGEHDFGAFEHADIRYFWKIDYYAPSLDAGSEDPSDPRKTTRVLTIMRADEY